MWRGLQKESAFVKKQDLNLQDGRGCIVLWETKPGAVHGKKGSKTLWKNYPEDKKLRQSNNADKVAQDDSR